MSKDDDKITVEMGEVSDTRLYITFSVEDVEHQAHFTNTGVPHVVLFVADLEGTDVAMHGREIRFHEAFQPAGANVNFVRVSKEGQVEIRTYERGVEAETLACGTGVVAAAVIAHLVARVEPPVHVHVQSGHVLTVGFRREGDSFAEVTLSGPAVHVYDGIYRAGSGPPGRVS